MVGTLAESGFPLLFVVLRARPVKWSGIGGHGVVEISLEADTVGGVRVPFAEDEVNLLGHSFVVLILEAAVRRVDDGMDYFAYRVREPAPTIFCSVAKDQ